MSAVEVELAPDEETHDEDDVREEPPPRRRRRDSVEVEVEREVTKRQLIQSGTTILVVVLYMIFTLLRDRDAGVVVLDGDEGDDWAE